MTVSVDTTSPTATVAVSGQAPGGVVSGTVAISGTSADAVSGVASSVLHVGPAGSCPVDPVVGSAWNTATLGNGSYDVCNIVTDRAGHTTAATVRVTVANIAPLAVVPARRPGAGRPARGRARLPPGRRRTRPTKLSVVVPRARHGAAPVPVALHWRNPVGVDLDRVVVVLNHARPPRTPADGSIVYRGLGTAATLKLRPGHDGFLALFAVDRSGQVSHAARRIVSLARAALRPLSGSVVSKRPRLSWRARRHTAYYNLQVFHKGKRILVRWPARATYRVPAGRLEPGTYVWYVWPAVRHRGAAPTFGKLIGRATFVVRI